MTADPSTLDQSATTPQGDAAAETTYNATEARNTSLVTLADLCAKGTSNYAHKQYDEAADYFAQASELQAELNGEMDPANAEVLFLYGRSLFRVGQGKSDVLGGRAGGEKKKKEGGKEKKEKREAEGEREKEEGVAAVVAGQAEGKAEEKKPLFQFTGDENFEDSDDEDVEEGEGDEEEEDDELATAFEVLDLARVLFTRKLEGPDADEAETDAAPAANDNGKGKGKEVGDSSMTRHVKERLADTHDLLAEISLENERFPNAVDDFRAALAYKTELHAAASEVVAEAHYKLSLALEFASITTTGDAEAEGEAKGEAHVDEGMREEAARELERAIESTRLKLAAKEVELAQTASPEENEVTRQQIAEVREIVADMEQRVSWAGPSCPGGVG